MELRSSPGEVLDRVARDGEVFVVERNGHPKACLVPVSFLLPDIPPDRIAKELSKLDGKNENYKLTINDHKELEISSLETAAGEDIAISIVLPHGYPNTAPRIYAEPVAPDTPKRWLDGSLSIFGVTAAWNVKTHDAAHALSLARLWLKHYAKWRKTGIWPERTDAP
ncbi:MAG: type II toxin-antitoxin system Phd/YefM family antitoxin [Xanthobacteraceae bacterium]